MSQTRTDDLDIDLTEEGAQTAPATGPAADLVEGEDDEDAPKLPAGAEKLEGAATHAGAAYRYTLSMPVKLTVRSQSGVVREEMVEKITMHRATAADLDAMMNSRTDAQRVLLCRLTRLPPTRAGKIYEKLDGADIVALLQIMDFLLANGRKTGR